MVNIKKTKKKAKQESDGTVSGSDNAKILDMQDCLYSVDGNLDIDKTQGYISEGRQELNDALKWLNKFKSSIAEWESDQDDFFENLNYRYEAKRSELEDNNESDAPNSSIMAIVSTAKSYIPAIFNSRKDPTQRQLGEMLEGIVGRGYGMYSTLETHLKTHEEKFEKIDELNESLLNDLEKYTDELRAHEENRKTYKAELQEKEAILGEMETQGSEYIKLKKEILETKRNYEGTMRKRSKVLVKLASSKNTLGSLEDFRDGEELLITQGWSIYESLKTSTDNLKPIFDQITSAADLAELKVKTLEAYQIQKRAMNTAMITVAALSKAAGKYANEEVYKPFLEESTTQTFKAITDAHKEDIEQYRLDHEQPMIESLLSEGGSDKVPDLIDMAAGDDGKYANNNTSLEKD